jgi:hypothetical protein
MAPVHAPAARAHSREVERRSQPVRAPEARLPRNTFGPLVQFHAPALCNAGYSYKLQQDTRRTQNASRGSRGKYTSGEPARDALYARRASDQTTVRRQRPLSLRALSTLRPLRVLIRFIKPCSRFRGMRFGCQVRFMVDFPHPFHAVYQGIIPASPARCQTVGTAVGAGCGPGRAAARDASTAGVPPGRK